MSGQTYPKRKSCKKWKNKSSSSTYNTHSYSWKLNLQYFTYTSLIRTGVVIASFCMSEDDTNTAHKTFLNTFGCHWFDPYGAIISSGHMVTKVWVNIGSDNDLMTFWHHMVNWKYIDFSLVCQISIIHMKLHFTLQDPMSCELHINYL